MAALTAGLYDAAPPQLRFACGKLGQSLVGVDFYLRERADGERQGAVDDLRRVLRAQQRGGFGEDGVVNGHGGSHMGTLLRGGGF